MEQVYEFKASSVELATKKGLEELGLTEEEAEIEVVSAGGIFAKALVRITPKKQVEAEEIEEEAEELPAMEESEDEAEETEEEGKPERRRERVRRDREPDEAYLMKKEMREKGKEFVKEMVRLMGYDVEVEGKIHEDEVCLYLTGEDAKNLIGHKGETLEALQTVADRYLNKGKEERVRVVLDAAFYRERRRKTLTGLAKKLAEQAYRQKREISLEPMNSYERRIIHAALANSEEATTRSEGEGKYRHVVIVPNVPVMSYGNSSEFRKKGPAKTKSYGYEKRKF